MINLLNKKGQAMLLSVILITSAVLGIATLVGSLMVYEIRYSYDVIASAKALFAADAGIECAIYQKYGHSSRDCGSATPGEILLDNGAKYRISFDAATNSATSVGTYGPPTRQTARSFQATF